MTGLNLTNTKFVYVRGKNRFGDLQGILFEMEKKWEWVKKEAEKSLLQDDFCNLIKNICMLRNVKVANIPVNMQDIEFAVEAMKGSLSTNTEKDTYEKTGSGYLRHKKNGNLYISSYGCSCILHTNPDAKRPQKKGYKTGITAAKAVIRSMTALGYWKMTKIDDETEIFTDNRALWECASDFLVDGKHHMVHGYIPTEVFQASKTMKFVFEVDK